LEAIKIKLGDVITLKRGYDLTNTERGVGSIPVFSSSGLSGFHSEYKVNGPGVITGRYGTLGEVFYSENDFWPHNTTLYVKDFKGNHPKYIYYFLKTLGFDNQNDKTSVPGVNRNHLHDLFVKFIPDLPTQSSIASILSALDDKIELNRLTNHTLEQMAQTLFKKYFVDDIDPDNLPEGWRWGKLGDLCTINTNTLSKAYNFKSLQYIEISEVSKGNVGTIAFYERGKEPSRARRLLNDGDTVLSTVRPDRGAYFLAINPPPNLVVSTGFAVFSPKQKVALSFINQFLIQEESFKYYGFMAHGAAYPAINPNTILKMEIPVPNVVALSEFNGFAEPLLRQVSKNNEESRTLNVIRNTLLPKLMSGEIEV
jgi:type I restriction enzyme S subunit